jgi:hypothetical protein
LVKYQAFLGGLIDLIMELLGLIIKSFDISDKGLDLIIKSFDNQAF